MTALPDDLKRLLAEEPFVRRLARQLVADEADDIVQQTWLRALQARGGPIERPRHWLARVLRNVVSDRRRREQRRQLLQQWKAPEGLVPSSSELLAVEERRRELVAAVDALPSPLRTVVLLRYYDGLPPRRIAAKLGLPATTVWNRLHDGLQQLRQRLHARHGERRAWVVPFLPFITSPRGMPWREVLGPAAAYAGTGVIAMTKTNLVVGAAAVMVAFLAWSLWPAPDAGLAQPEGPRGGAAPVVAALDAEPKAAPAPGELGRVAAPDTPTVAAKTGTLLVHVRYGSEPHEAAGLAVRVIRSTIVRAERPSVAITDDAGTARFEGMAPGRVWVDTNVRPVIVKAAEIEVGATRECMLELAGGMTLRGVVVDPHGIPVAGALLELTRPQFGTPAAAVGHSAADGTFAIRECDTTAVIGARAAGHAASQVYLVEGTPGSTQQMRIELQPAGGCVAGVVVDAEGRPVEGATVRVGAGRTEAISVTAQGGAPLPAQVVTDSEGRFLAIGVREGTQPLHAFAPGHAPWLGSCDAVAGTTVLVRVVLPVGVTCEGNVLDQDRRPLAGVTVRNGGTDDLARYAAETDENGAFTIRGLPPPAAKLSGWDKEAGKGTVVVRGAAGETVHVELVLSQGLQLRGRVVDETGAPAQVHVYCSSSGAKPWHAEAICDERGQFRLGHCPVGLLSVRITERGYLPLTQQGLDPAAGEVVLRLQRDTRPCAKIVGRLLLPGGRPAAAETVSASPSDVPMVAEEVIVADDGSFAFEVPPGTWGVHANVPNFAPRLVRWQPVQPGATWDVGVLQLARGGALVVTGGAKADDCSVVDANGDSASSLDAPVGPPRSRLLHPGEYVLLVRGENLTAQAIPFTIRDGEDTKLAVPPLAGVRQRFEFVASPGTELPRWVACDVRHDGKLVTICGPNQRDGDRIVMNLWLAPGSYTLATQLRERPSTASFVVGAQEGTPVGVALH